MTPGRPPKPTERKRRTGNPGKRSLPDLATVVHLPAAIEVPEPSRPLGPSGLALWSTAWTAARAWLSPDTDAQLVLMVCEQLDERDALRPMVLQTPHPLVRKSLRDLEKAIATNLSLLGFTPTDRARLGMAEVVTMSKLEALRAQR